VELPATGLFEDALPRKGSDRRSPGGSSGHKKEEEGQRKKGHGRGDVACRTPGHDGKKKKTFGKRTVQGEKKGGTFWEAGAGDPSSSNDKFKKNRVKEDSRPAEEGCKRITARRCVENRGERAREGKRISGGEKKRPKNLARRKP